jgi:hypothetical protein
LGELGSVDPPASLRVVGSPVQVLLPLPVVDLHLVQEVLDGLGETVALP